MNRMNNCKPIAVNIPNTVNIPLSPQLFFATRTPIPEVIPTSQIQRGPQHFRSAFIHQQGRLFHCIHVFYNVACIHYVSSFSILSFALTDQDISVFIMLRMILPNPIVLALNIILLSGQLRQTHCESGRFVFFDLGVL